jgi:hypothetical protein
MRKGGRERKREEQRAGGGKEGGEGEEGGERIGYFILVIESKLSPVATCKYESLYL